MFGRLLSSREFTLCSAFRTLSVFGEEEGWARGEWRQRSLPGLDPPELRALEEVRGRMRGLVGGWGQGLAWEQALATGEGASLPSFGRQQETPTLNTRTEGLVGSPGTARLPCPGEAQT